MMNWFVTYRNDYRAATLNCKSDIYFLVLHTPFLFSQKVRMMVLSMINDVDRDSFIFRYSGHGNHVSGCCGG